MASLYILSEKHKHTGTRPQTPKQKFKKLARVLTVALIIETLVIIYLLRK